MDEIICIDTPPTAEAARLALERLARLSACLARLSGKTREVFLAHRIEGLSYKEIAQRQQLSISAVEKHVAKATMQVTIWMRG